MNFTTVLIILVIYLILLVLSMFIENTTFKMYYFLIIILGTLAFLNVYLAFYYYIKLRNEPGVPGPRGPKGDPGAIGKKGSCDINQNCTADGKITTISPAMYQEIANRFNTTPECLQTPSRNSCMGGAQEVRRIEPISSQIKMLEAMAEQRNMTQKQMESKLSRTLSALE